MDKKDLKEKVKKMIYSSISKAYGSNKTVKLAVDSLDKGHPIHDLIKADINQMPVPAADQRREVQIPVDKDSVLHKGAKPLAGFMASRQKGVHESTNVLRGDKGMSPAGVAVRVGNTHEKNHPAKADYNDAAKEVHHSVLAEQRAMPKPNIPQPKVEPTKKATDIVGAQLTSPNNPPVHTGSPESASDLFAKKPEKKLSPQLETKPYAQTSSPELEKAKVDEGKTIQQKKEARDSRGSLLNKPHLKVYAEKGVHQPNSRTSGNSQAGLYARSAESVKPYRDHSGEERISHRKKEYATRAKGYHNDVRHEQRNMPAPNLGKSASMQKKQSNWGKLHGKLEREGYSSKQADRIAGSIKAKMGKSEHGVPGKNRPLHERGVHPAVTNRSDVHNGKLGRYHEDSLAGARVKRGDAHGAKRAHQEIIQEIRSMPRPNLGKAMHKSEGDLGTKIAEAKLNLKPLSGFMKSKMEKSNKLVAGMAGAAMLGAAGMSQVPKVAEWEQKHGPVASKINHMFDSPNSAYNKESDRREKEAKAKPIKKSSKKMKKSVKKSMKKAEQPTDSKLVKKPWTDSKVTPAPALTKDEGCDDMMMAEKMKKANPAQMAQKQAAQPKAPSMGGGVPAGASMNTAPKKIIPATPTIPQPKVAAQGTGAGAGAIKPPMPAQPKAPKALGAFMANKGAK